MSEKNYCKTSCHKIATDDTTSWTVSCSSDVIGYIGKIESLGGLDGPGIRTVIFLTGCPQRCKYCHNADFFAIESGREMTVREVVKFCEKYKSYYGENGGVTLSGGEPLVQAEFVLALVNELKTLDINVALDTSGCIFFPEIYDIVDLVILDIKHTDRDKYKWLTSFEMDNTCKTLQYLQQNNLKFWIRQVILTGFNDTVEQIEALKNMAFGAEKIELLPYHDMGKNKWTMSKYELNVDPPTIDKLIKLKEVLYGN